jgi:hypothetical protein
MTIPESRTALASKLRDKAEELVVAVGVTDIAIDCQKLMQEAASEIMILSHEIEAFKALLADKERE